MYDSDRNKNEMLMMKWAKEYFLHVYLKQAFSPLRRDQNCREVVRELMNINKFILLGEINDEAPLYVEVENVDGCRVMDNAGNRAEQMREDDRSSMMMEKDDDAWMLKEEA